MDNMQFAAPLCVKNERFNNNAEMHFNDIYSALERLLSCTYLFYMFENTDISKRITFSTNLEWQSVYVNDNLIINCPLLYVGRNQMERSKSKSTILRWNDVTPSSKAQKNVMGIRDEFNIANGISFAREYLGIREMVGIASDVRNDGFSRDVILHMNTINAYLLQLRKIAICELTKKAWVPVINQASTTIH